MSYPAVPERIWKFEDILVDVDFDFQLSSCFMSYLAPNITSTKRNLENVPTYYSSWEIVKCNRNNVGGYPLVISKR